MQRWEYLYLTIRHSGLEYVLDQPTKTLRGDEIKSYINEFGSQGWELVAITDLEDDGQLFQRLWFKRQLTDGP